MKDILDDLGIAYQIHGDHHHTTEGFLQVDCPYCSPASHKWRMGLAVNGRAAHCWSCGTHRIGNALCEITGLSWQKIKEALAHLTNLVYKSEYGAKHATRLTTPVGIGKLLAPHRAYLEDRRHDPDALEAMWQIGGIGLHHKLAWRLYVPIIHKHKQASWTTRALHDEGLRYISASSEEESTPHKHLLYGEDYCQHSIIVVEGCFDVWRIGPGSVATLGTSYSTAQLRKISKYPTRVVCFDADAQHIAKKLCKELGPFPGKTLNVCLSAKDPDEASKEELEELRLLAGI